MTWNNLFMLHILFWKYCSIFELAYLVEKDFNVLVLLLQKW
jgi:hypothetical protein